MRSRKTPNLPALAAGAAAVAISLSSCSRSYDATVPPSSALGSPRGNQIVRVIEHYHTPYSWDACDQTDVTAKGVDQRCLADFRNALCYDRIDYAFVTDHNDHFGDYEFTDLLMVQTGDTYTAGSPPTNQIGSCRNGQKPVMMTGLETDSRLGLIGADAHVSTSVTARKATYSTTISSASDLNSLASTLKSGNNGLSIVVHTETIDNTTLSALTNVDAIEIYNIHANLDFKYRGLLGLPLYDHLPKLTSFLVDPYGSLLADFAFMQFVYLSPVYLSKWDTMITAGLKPAGWGGSDSHENVFPQTTSDGERLDSHRRLLRFMSNHVLVSSSSAANARTALKNGNGWLVFEGLGSPVGMDFYGTIGATTLGPGNSGSLGASTLTLTVKAPTVYANKSYGSESPVIRIELHQVASNTDTIVAQSTGSDLVYNAPSSGTFRAQIYITPKHLRPLLGPYSSSADIEYPWIVTNHIYVTP